MSATVQGRNEDPFAQASRLRERRLQQADLASRSGNDGLAAKLRALADDARIAGVEYFELPSGGSIEEVWRKLGFNYDPQYGDWRIDGIYRRCAAVIKSIRHRGFNDREVTLSGVDARGFREFMWNSEAGHWKSRHWRVTGRLRFSRGQLEITDVVIYTKGWKAEQEGRIEWSAFTGAALNDVLAKRLAAVLAVIGARLAVRSKKAPSVSPLTKEEQDAMHDLHPSPVAAFCRGNDRVVLWDDAYGSGRLEGGTEEFRAWFIKQALDHLLDHLK